MMRRQTMTIIRPAIGRSHPLVGDELDAELRRRGLPLPRSHFSHDSVTTNCGRTFERVQVLGRARATSLVACRNCCPRLQLSFPHRVAAAAAVARQFAALPHAARAAAAALLAVAVLTRSTPPADAAALPPAQLAAIVARCAPHVHPQTQGAVVAIESGGDPYALGDNDTGRSFHPPSYEAAYALANVLIAADAARHGRGVDVGLAQINSRNFPAAGVTVAQMLDPCANLTVSARMLRAAYLAHGSVDAALQVYNSGSPRGDAGYVARVRAAAIGSYVRSTTHVASAPPARPHVPRHATAPARTAHFTTEG
jgi:type IV secretion system protein VirB1